MIGERNLIFQRIFSLNNIVWGVWDLYKPQTPQVKLTERIVSSLGLRVETWVLSSGFGVVAVGVSGCD